MYLLQARGKSLNLVLVLLFTLVGLWYSNVNIMHLNMEIYFSRSFDASSLFSFLILCRLFDYFLSRLSYTFCIKTLKPLRTCVFISRYRGKSCDISLTWFFLQRFFSPVITFAVCKSLEKPGF